MAKATKKKSAKEASTTFHNIIAASVKDKPKPMKQHPIEKIPVTNGNIYQLRVVESGLIHHAEISQETVGGRVKQIETIQFNGDEDVEEIKSLVREYISSKSSIEDTLKSFRLVDIHVSFKHPEKKVVKKK